MRRWIAVITALAVAVAAVLVVTAAGPAPRDGGGARRAAGVIELPRDYSYEVLASACVDETMTRSGAEFAMPGDFDANVVVERPGRPPWLLSAHELAGPVPGACAARERAGARDRDANGPGSVSRLTLAPGGTAVHASALIATGMRNLCAAALTPWGTLLVNEESPPPGDRRAGWVWQIDPRSGAQRRATGMGRMSHEQEALYRGAWYLTDDRGNFQYLYKFVPDHRRDLSAGKLYGLKFDRATETGGWVGPLDPTAPEEDMVARVGAPTATNAFDKHEGIVRDPRGRGVVFAESATGDDPGRVWLLRDGPGGAHASVLAEGGFARMSRPDNVRFNARGDLLVLEDNGDDLARPATGGTNEAYVLPAGHRGAAALRRFATIGGRGEATGPWFSRDGRLLYLSIQDQPRPDGSRSRVIAIRAPRSFNRIARGH